MRDGDRLGVFIERAPGSVSYTFNQHQPRALAHHAPHTGSRTPYAVNEDVMFDDLVFPYDFSLSAHIDTALESYSNPDAAFPICPRGLLIPDYEQVTLAPVTPGPGLIGATGATGFSGVPGRNGVQGATGPAGPRGMKGDTGEAGPPGPKGDEPMMPYPNMDDNGDGPLEGSDINLVLLIWLCVLSIMFLLLLILLCMCYKKVREFQLSKHDKSKQAELKGVSNTAMSGDAAEKRDVTAPSANTYWLDSLREQSEQQYRNDVIADSAPDIINRRDVASVDTRTRHDVRARQTLPTDSAIRDAQKAAGARHGQSMVFGQEGQFQPPPDVPKHELLNY